ncbi:hypothetical protein NSK11_contig00062-0028 [Nocardia seriolae]|uniref:Uncharacterized protein n=1 Tax=Nocardia seriolae TaxID=37332 RepID=A0ABC9YX21_9NOCA|nr:hypothetical protein NS07_v2contig00059-0010 [Nocardia seriolae]GAP29720.1 hypothetical protein NSK11_contig00062-0028 [Nocardia seriolae]
MTHCASVRFRPRSVTITGRATPTMVPSTTIIDSPAASTPSPIHAVRSARGGVAAVVGSIFIVAILRVRDGRR